MNDRISFPLNKKSVAFGRNTEFVQNIFPQDGKSASKGKDTREIGTNLFSMSQYRIYF